jgi:hypothetical protein
MTRRGTVVAVLLVLIAGSWGLLAYATRPPGAHEYRVDARQAAGGALSGVRTVVLAGRAEAADKVLDPYLATVLDDATDAVRTAQSDLAGQPPPDGRTRAMRDELAPLLAQAVQEVGDVSVAVGASDSRALSAAIGHLQHLGDQLSDFLERHS